MFETVLERYSATAGPLGHFWYHKLDQVASSCLQPSTASFVAAKVVGFKQNMPLAVPRCYQIALGCILQVAADTFIYTPLNVGLFFAWITIVEGGGWTVGKYTCQPQPTTVCVIACVKLYIVHRRCATSFSKTFCLQWELRLPSGLLIRPSILRVCPCNISCSCAALAPCLIAPFSAGKHFGI